MTNEERLQQLDIELMNELISLSSTEETNTTTTEEEDEFGWLPKEIITPVVQPVKPVVATQPVVAKPVVEVANNKIYGNYVYSDKSDILFKVKEKHNKKTGEVEIEYIPVYDGKLGILENSIYLDTDTEMFEAVVLAHTHKVGETKIGNIYLFEQGACCDVTKMNYVDGKLQQPQKEGFMFICQDDEGNLIKDKTKLIELN